MRRLTGVLVLLVPGVAGCRPSAPPAGPAVQVAAGGCGTGWTHPHEQKFLVHYINALQASPEWKSTAVVIAYDDSDGWYDHVTPPVVNGSNDPANDTAMCTAVDASGGYQDRCGYGPRTPLLVVSPYSKVNYVDHTVTDQSSILKFVEDNWGLGRIGDSSFDAIAGSLDGMLDLHGRPATKPVTLDETTGAVVHP